jgi:ribonuclease P protein component
VGKAVQRNKAKRLLRAALQDVIQDIQPGYQGILIAREPLLDASFQDINQALHSLLQRAGIGPSNEYG